MKVSKEVHTRHAFVLDLFSDVRDGFLSISTPYRTSLVDVATSILDISAFPMLGTTLCPFIS